MRERLAVMPRSIPPPTVSHVAPTSSPVAVSHRSGERLQPSLLLDLQATSGNRAVTSLLTARVAAPRKACSGSCPVSGPEEVTIIDQRSGKDPAVRRTIGDGRDLMSPRFAGDVKLEACFDDEARLTKGDTGASVTKVQQALVELGYDLG